MRKRNHIPKALVLLAGLLGCRQQPAGPSLQPDRPALQPPFVAGLGRAGLDPVGRGLVLLEELGCVACHAAAEAASGAAPHGPDLATVFARLRPSYLSRFLAEPGRCEPGTAMPDLLHDLDDDARRAAARALADYLRSFSQPAPEPAPEWGDAAVGQRGRELFHAIGCALCHAPHDEVGDAPVGDATPMATLAEKYTEPALREFLLAPLVARPAGRMPDLGLTASEAHDVAHYLHARTPFLDLREAVPPPEAAQVALGRTLFAERGCGHCHPLPDPVRPPSRAPKPLRDLDASRGCLSFAVGAWPFYPLSDEQRRELTAALAARAAPRTDEQRIQQRLAASNCFACHTRGEFGGVRADRSFLCTSNDPSLGQESRLPPALTGVGAKLQPGWLRDAIAHGQRERPYLRTRMPAFGAAVAEPLAELFARADVLPPPERAPVPQDDEARRKVIELGRTLVGDQGMNCIACHTFAGERAGAMGAIDLVATTGQRLQAAWFAHFLRSPFRFNPGTVMPQFFPGGASTRPELGDGTAAAQIEAIWQYLAEGRNGRKPSGMRRPPIELVVGAEAVLLRRSVQHTGKRGISVGLPGGVHCTFDAERLAMNQVWWGPFVDAAGVWTAQGSGEVRILGKDRVALPSGPGCAILPTPDAPWPTATRRELGHRWLGYDLDAQQRPTFRYTCGEVTVEDAMRERMPAGAPASTRSELQRTLRCRGPNGAVVTFLVARDANIEALGGGVVKVGAALHLRLPAADFRILEVGEQREVRVSLALVDGRAECVVDYAFVEVGK
ncbi:MAG: c-type cytochrome [Planctomycetes bacterium]|nr:c-type cytochrome [Planctomycetota bacterium]